MATRVVGLAGTGVTIDAALKLGGHAALTVLACRSRRRWWWAMAAVSVTADVIMALRINEDHYRPGLLRYAWEAADAAAWANVTGDGSGTPARVMTVNSVSSSVMAGWHVGAGVDALPVYDPLAPFPPSGPAQVGRFAGRVGVPVLVPFAAAWAARRAAGRNTSWTNLSWGAAGAVSGFVFARNRHSLQRRSRQIWAERSASLVVHEQSAARLRLMAASSPGHDFKKTLFALGLEGSDAALQAAKAQGARPGETRAGLPGLLLGEASHRARIEPAEQALRLLTAEQAAELQRFLAAAADTAADGIDQTLSVRELDSFTTEISYLGSRLIVRSDPPPLTAELNPTAGSFLIGALLKAQGLHPGTGELHPAVVAALSALDLAAFAHFWHRPVTADSQRGAIRIAALTCFSGIAAALTPLARLQDDDGTDLYPSLEALRDLLLVLLPNWDTLRPSQKALVPLGAAAAIGAISYRRRHTGVDWLGMATQLATVTNALAVLRASSRVEQEAALLERQLFDRYAEQLLAAWQAGEAEELSSYTAQLQAARAALDELPGLDPRLRHDIEADCARLEAWLEGYPQAR